MLPPGVLQEVGTCTRLMQDVFTFDIWSYFLVAEICRLPLMTWSWSAPELVAWIAEQCCRSIFLCQLLYPEAVSTVRRFLTEVYV
jgi:hypothetical protein